MCQILLPLLFLGFSHEIKYKIPKGVKVKVEKQTKINIVGPDKELVARTASEIKSIKPVEPYKAKGIKEKNQYVLLEMLFRQSNL